MGSTPTLGSKMRRYARYSSNEERKNIRNAFVFGILTIGVLVLVLFAGIPLVARFTGYVSDIGRPTKISIKNDTTPPGPPHLDALPTATNKNALDISGTAEPDATVVIYVNGSPEEVSVGSDGTFTHAVSLVAGDNAIGALARDASGNESQKTDGVTVTYSDRPPKLEVSSPNDGTDFAGSKNKQINIQGSVDINVTLTINDRLVKINDDGTFSFSITLSDGDNTFSLKAVDDAGNTSEKSLTVHFTS